MAQRSGYGISSGFDSDERKQPGRQKGSQVTSIRDYDGEIGICASCGQPCYPIDAGDYGAQWNHFTEQWDGVWCRYHPLAGNAIDIDWDPGSLESLKQRYPDTSPKEMRRGNSND